MSRPDRVLLVITAIIAGVALMLSSQGGEEKDNWLNFSHSSYSNHPSGSKGLYTVLQRLGYTVQRWRAPLDTLEDGTAIIMLNPRSPDWDAVRRWVVQGHVAILAMDAKLEVAAPDKVDFVHPLPWGPCTGVNRLAVYGSDRLEGNLDLPPELLKGAPLASDAHGTMAMWTPMGHGAFLVLQSSWSLSNGGLKDGEATSMVVNSLGMAEHSGPVLFDEFDQGYRDSTRLWDVMPESVRWGLMQLLVLLGLWMAAAAVRPRPPLTMASGLRSRAEYLASLASLMQRNRHPRYALDLAAARLPDNDKAAAWRKRAASVRDDAAALKLTQEARALEEEDHQKF